MTSHATIPADPVTICPSCEGTGRARMPWRTAYKGVSWWETSCFWCEGTGKVTRYDLQRYIRRYPHGEPSARPRQVRVCEGES